MLAQPVPQNEYDDDGPEFINFTNTRWHRLGVIARLKSNLVGDLLYFFSYPLLPIILLLVLGLVSGAVGGGVGTRFLIFHADPARELMVGLFLGILGAECLLIGFLLRLKHRKTTAFATLPNFYLYTVNILIGMALVGVGLVGLGELTGIVTGVPSYEGDPTAADLDEVNRIPLWFGLAVGYMMQALAISIAPLYARSMANALARATDIPVRAANTLFGRTIGLGVLLAMAVGCCVTMHFTHPILGYTLAAIIVASISIPAAYAHLDSERGFSKALLFFVVIGYIGFTWARAQWSFRVSTPVGLGIIVGLIWTLHACFPNGFTAFVRRFEERLVKELGEGKQMGEDKGETYLNYHVGAAIAVPLFGLIFVAFSLAPSWTSPVPTFCYTMYVLVAIYGALRYISRRTVPITMAVLGGLLLLGGMPAYKQRFGGALEFHYENGHHFDLAAALEQDHERQRLFDVAAVTNDPLLPVYAHKFDNENRIVPIRDIRPTSKMLGLADYTDETEKRNRLLAVQDIQPPEPGRRKPLVLFCVSGGGLRAAAWTFATMQALEMEFAKKGIDFPAHVRLVTGASGGMLGAASYVGSLPHPAKRAKGRDREVELTNRFQCLTADCLTPLVNQMVFADIPAAFSPWPQKHDRGKALEQSWIDNGLNELALSFDDLRQGEIDGWRPSLVFSPMMIEDGRRLLVSNLDLRYVASNDGQLIIPDALCQVKTSDVTSENFSREAFELFRMFPAAKRDFRLATAVRMSATFPFFTPAVSLPTKPRRRIVDAGYYDNYGVSILAAWLFSGKNREWIETNASKIVIVQVRAWPSEESRTLGKLEKTASSPFTRALEEIVSVPEALDGGRTASASFRNDGQLELTSSIFRARQEANDLKRDPGDEAADSFDLLNLGGKAVRDHSYYTVVNFEPKSGGVLSWYLSAEEIARLKDESRCPENMERIKKLIDWWGK